MRTLIVAIVLSLMSCAAIAQSGGLLTYFTEDGQKFWVIINGQKINQEAAYLVKDIPVNVKYGKVKIIFEEDFPAISKNFQVVDVDDAWCHVKYMIKKNKKGVYDIRILDATYEVLTTPTPTQTTPPPAQTTSTPPAKTTATPPAQTTPAHPSTQIRVNESPESVKTNVGVQVTDPVTGQPVTMGINLEINAPGINTETTTQTKTTEQPQTTTQTQVTTQATAPSHYVMPGYNGKIGCSWPMSEAEFSNLKKSIASKSFEDSKLTLAKQAASANCLLCSQVKQIMQLFSFEDSKLEFAKYAWDYTYDISNFYQLNDAFTFESTIDELNAHIQKRRK